MDYDDLPDRFDLSPDGGGRLSMFFKAGELIVEVVDENRGDEAYLALDHRVIRDLHVRLVAMALGESNAIEVQVNNSEYLVINDQGPRVEVTIWALNDENERLDEAPYHVWVEQADMLRLSAQLTALVFQQGASLP